MTATRKLFIAAVMLAAGFAVAKLLGTPTPRLRPPQSKAVALTRRSTTPQASQAQLASASANASLRLVPDLEAVNSGKTTIDPLIDIAPPLLSSPPSQALDSPIAREMYGLEREPSRAMPRAKLRNEAPRPLAIESREQPASKQLPVDSLTIEKPSITPSSAPPSAPPSGWPTGDARQASFDQAAARPPAITAAYNETSGSTTSSAPITPPPWPAPDETGGPRHHIIVDGDSLARLAGRYLHDPRRSEEIFEANRAVLADPELLPIGVELVIPSRTNSPAIGSATPQSRAPRAVAIHAAANAALIPVRPVPSTEGIVPRARLSRPLAAE